MGLAVRWAYRIAIGPKPPAGVAQAARKRASARLLALIAKPRGRGAHYDWLCRTLLMCDHRLPLSFDAGVGCGQACGRGHGRTSKDVAAELTTELLPHQLPGRSLLPSNCYGLFQYLGHLLMNSAAP